MDVEIDEDVLEATGLNNVFVGFKCPKCGKEWTGRGSNIDEVLWRAAREHCPNKCIVPLVEAFSIATCDDGVGKLDSNIFAEMLSDRIARMEPPLFQTALSRPWLVGYIKGVRFHGGLI